MTEGKRESNRIGPSGIPIKTIYAEPPKPYKKSRKVHGRVGRGETNPRENPWVPDEVNEKIDKHRQELHEKDTKIRQGDLTLTTELARNDKEMSLKTLRRIVSKNEAGSRDQVQAAMKLIEASEKTLEKHGKVDVDVQTDQNMIQTLKDDLTRILDRNGTQQDLGND